MLKTFSGRNASQNEHELRGLIALMQERGVRSYLEVGARHGDTFHEVMISLPVGSRGVAVDLPGGLWGKESSVCSLRAAVDDLNLRGYEVDMVLGDSQTKEMRDLIQSKGPFDAVLLDGDHTYGGVSRDWRLYGNMAPLIAFHDVAGAGQVEKVHGNPVEVPRLWAEIKAMGLETVEFIARGSKMGIGVVLL